MGSETPRYTYEPVYEGVFRLIRLVDDDPRDASIFQADDLAVSPNSNPEIHPVTPLCAELVHSSFDHVVPYEALSYCWTGHRRATSAQDRHLEARMDRRILIKDPAGNVAGFIPISRSLESALAHIRGHTDKPLFVDQVCINQQDLVEKNYLVKRMGEIYTKAERVLAWLGPPTPEAEEFMTFMRQLEEDSTEAFYRLADHNSAAFNALRRAVVADNPNSDGNSGGSDADQLREQAEAIWDGLPLRGFFDLCSRQWFGRMWIVQEACLPKHLAFVCGSWVFEWGHFQRTALLVFLSTEMQAGRWDATLQQRDYPKMDDIILILGLVRYANRIFSVRRTLHHPEEARLSLFHILTRFNVADTMSPQTAEADLQKFRAGNARDCYYALLALPKQEESAITQAVVDYRKPVPLVFLDLAAALVQDSHADIILFSQHSPSHRRLPGLPSWVPDWSSELSAPYGYLNSSTPLFRAGIGNTWPAAATNTHVDRQYLVIAGHTVGTISRVGENAHHDSGESGPTSCSIHRFLCEVSHFCNLAGRKRKGFASASTPSPAPEIPPSVPWLLSTGGRGISSEPHKPASQRLGPEPGPGEIPLAGAAYEVSRKWYARHAETYERGQYALRMAALLAPLEAKWSEPRSWYRSLMLWLGWSDDSEEFTFHERFERHWAECDAAKKSALPRERGEEDEEEGYPQLQEVPWARGAYGLALDAQKERRCFVTPEGYVGLGPETMRVGDVIAVLKGVSVPLVLRADASDASGQGGFEYIGEAYCYGIMDGELVEARNSAEASTLYIA
ncbi:heterokaryon incompatibility protein-domain-containing protein [Podospora aff. communis PSN243]|uniref:Heterokaryon incompatibility protein-domain-containing protein n=1 Tax=Podospora aff. communis PSN243 TaxID=3040156 RepID=A0AAV9H8E1_9PEZI|nr:heterokaryon incompatibility protein-domain-containing protein [Podospora aff. communis PSN243]